MSAVLGIDVSKATLDCMVLKNGQQHYCQVDNTPRGFEQLRAWLAAEGVEQLHAALEATGRYGAAVALDLHTAGYKVSVVNPARIKAFAQSLLSRNKTDKQDALLIARFCQMHRPDPWQPTEPALERLQEQTRYLQKLKAMRTQERNRQQSGLSDPLVLQFIQEHLTRYDEEIAALEAAILAFIKQQPVLKKRYDLLISIPAIGKTTAPILIAEIGDVSVFDSAADLASYAGLTPRHFQSGSSINRPTHISKQGNSYLRTALYMPALSAPRWNPLCGDLARRLEKRHKSGKVIVIAVMHKLLRQAYGVLKHEQLFNPHFVDKQDIAA